MSLLLLEGSLSDLQSIWSDELGGSGIDPQSFPGVSQRISASAFAVSIATSPASAGRNCLHLLRLQRKSLPSRRSRFAEKAIFLPPSVPALADGRNRYHRPPRPFDSSEARYTRCNQLSTMERGAGCSKVDLVPEISSKVLCV